jgi:hypothetical protein
MILHILLRLMSIDAWFMYGMEWADRLVYAMMALNAAAFLVRELARQLDSYTAPCELGITCRAI